ncbi:hypothetical protein E3N88_13534 [Mikania micrantha]|uniref:Uncharacterized protein n=1 Tax=Mikania micrantha TaxID=192012 RepID=A0A5N6P8V8_9ASTR|nr:hypothetical protein E3N88_13534 [Mikania micrantha]
MPTPNETTPYSSQDGTQTQRNWLKTTRLTPIMHPAPFVVTDGQIHPKLDTSPTPHQISPTAIPNIDINKVKNELKNAVDDNAIKQTFALIALHYIVCPALTSKLGKKFLWRGFVEGLKVSEISEEVAEKFHKNWMVQAEKVGLQSLLELNAFNENCKNMIAASTRGLIGSDPEASIVNSNTNLYLFKIRLIEVQPGEIEFTGTLIRQRQKQCDDGDGTGACETLCRNPSRDSEQKTAAVILYSMTMMVVYCNQNLAMTAVNGIGYGRDTAVVLDLLCNL